MLLCEGAETKPKATRPPPPLAGWVGGKTAGTGQGKRLKETKKRTTKELGTLWGKSWHPVSRKPNFDSPPPRQLPPAPPTFASPRDFTRGLVGLRRRPLTFLSPLNLDSPIDFDEVSTARAKEKAQVNSPWVCLPLSPRSPTCTLDCHTLCGVPVAPPPCEAKKRQARVEGVSRWWGESFLHSPTTEPKLLRTPKASSSRPPATTWCAQNLLSM